MRIEKGWMCECCVLVSVNVYCNCVCSRTAVSRRCMYLYRPHVVDTEKEESESTCTQLMKLMMMMMMMLD